MRFARFSPSELLDRVGKRPRLADLPESQWIDNASVAVRPRYVRACELSAEDSQIELDVVATIVYVFESYGEVCRYSRKLRLIGHVCIEDLMDARGIRVNRNPWIDKRAPDLIRPVIRVDDMETQLADP